MASVPLVERYRPKIFESIVLDPINETLLQNMIQKRYMTNLLFYGPPGTGKTTTIINVIESYQREVEDGVNTERVIQLNASDERGIEIIRGTILQFVSSKNLFRTGIKFVVLDEVDYMTKNAQQALKHLIQECMRIGSPSNVRFCLICNYISKIEPGLRGEFIALPFHRLPTQKIHAFLQHISDNEGLGLTPNTIQRIQQWFQSDMRSMINFIQSNLLDGNHMNIIDDTLWDDFTARIMDSGSSPETMISFIHQLSISYNMDKKTIIKEYIQFIVAKNPSLLTTGSTFIHFIETLLHSPNTNTDVFVSYAITQLFTIFSKS